MAAVGAGVAAVAAAVLVAVGLIDDGNSKERHKPIPTPQPLAQAIALGVSPQTTLDGRDYDKIQAAGTDVIRMPMNWSHVQAAPGDCQPDTANGVCNWVDLDARIGNAAEAGARVLPILSDVPGWVSDEHTKPPLNGEARAGWEDFVDAAVRRYGPGGAFWDSGFTNPPYEGEPHPILEWQVWNEPNGKVYFKPKPNPRKYAYLVGITSDAIHAVDPAAEVLLAGMFGTAEVPLKPFLREMYTAPGIQADFDAIALHPYSKGLSELKKQIRWARGEAKAAGDSDVGLWITEMGWGSANGDHPLEKGKNGQARLLAKSFDLLSRRSDSWNVEGVIWFTWQDRLDRQVCQFCESAGLFDFQDGSKPSYDVFKQLKK